MTKQELSTYEIEEDAIITQINKILDDELMKATITNKFRDITDYTKDDKHIASEIFEILSTITDYDIACIHFHSPDASVQKRLIFHEQNVLIDDETMLAIWRQLLPDSINDFKPEKITSKNELQVLNSIDDFLSKKEFDFYYEDILIGKLCLFSRENLRWNKMRFMQTVKSELDLFLRLKYLYTKTCYLSITDELTQL